MNFRTVKGKYALAALLVICVAIIVTVLAVALTIPTIAAKRAVRKTEQQIDLAAVVTEVRNLSRLETAAMQVTHIGKIEQSYGVIPKSIAGDEITFLAVGDVIAGVDLGQIRDDQIRVRDKVAYVTLPPSQIFLTRIDNQKSRVIDRETGLLRKADVHLESRARAAAETSIRNEALRKGILTLADRNAEQRIGDLLRKFGFQQVHFSRPTRPHPSL